MAKAMDLKKKRIGIIGGGRMGCGIAFIFAAAGCDISIFEPDDKRRAALSGEIIAIAELLDVSTSRFGVMGFHSALEDVAVQSDFIIEAVPERLELKQSIFEQLDAAAPDNAILATNTSAIPIREISKKAKNKNRIIGAHFWNPPHLIEIVELIKGDDSDQAVVDEAMELFLSVGMTPVLVKKDVPGFIGNRLQHALKREAIAMVAAGICDAQTLDTVVKKSFGARLPVMGPLEQSDLLGLELTMAVHKTLMPEIDVTPVPHPYMAEKIAQGKTGAAAGEGFRKWTQAEADEARRVMDEYLVAAARPRYRQEGHS